MSTTPDEDWLDVLEKTDFEPEETSTNSYQSYRFTDLDIAAVTIENYADMLVPSLVEQVSMFIPPSGSFETPDLRRYLELVCGYETSTSDIVLGLSLADQIRITFSDMKISTICDRYPTSTWLKSEDTACWLNTLLGRGN